MWFIWLIRVSVQALIFKYKPIKLIVGQDRFDYNNNNNHNSNDNSWYK